MIFRSSNSQIKRYYLSLQDTDLYCYETEAKDKLKFMHSLIGSFVIDTLKADVEQIEGKAYRKLEIKISEFFKRIFYLPCFEEPIMTVENEIRLENLSAAFPNEGEDLLDQGHRALKTWIEKLRQA